MVFPSGLVSKAISLFIFSVLELELGKKIRMKGFICIKQTWNQINLDFLEFLLLESRF